MCKIGLQRIGGVLGFAWRWVWAPVLGLIFVFFVSYPVDAGSVVDPVVMLHKVDMYRGYEHSFRMRVRVLDYDQKGDILSFMIFRTFIRDRASTFLTYIYPPIDKGKVMLMVDENIWFYHRKISKPIRISPRQRLLGNVSNSDVARANFSIDYTPTLKGEQNVDGQPCHILLLQAVNNQVAYFQIKLYISKTDYRPIKGIFYAFSGRVLKTAFYSSFQFVGDTLKIFQVDIYDAIQTDKRTVIQYSDYRVSKLPKHYFNPAFLPRLKRFP